MVEQAVRQARGRDAQRTREVILDAAQVVFSEHGFDGARIDAIAKASGYNTSLLFQYYTDKLGLYVAVLKQADQELNALLESMLTPWLSNKESILSTSIFREFLQTLVRTTFDYLVSHPQFLRILTWEMAEGWKSYTQVASHFSAVENEQITVLFQQALAAGLLRSDFIPLVQLTLIVNLCQSYLASLPLYQLFVPAEKIASPASLARARDYLTNLVVTGMMTSDIQEKNHD
jgi:AcrR family transcriptional regulator